MAGEEEGTQPPGDLSYVQYDATLESEFLPSIRALISKDLSEPYSIYVYRYFLYQWADLCFLVCEPSLFQRLTDLLPGDSSRNKSPHRSRDIKAGTSLLALALNASRLHSHASNDIIVSAARCGRASVLPRTRNSYSSRQASY